MHHAVSQTRLEKPWETRPLGTLVKAHRQRLELNQAELGALVNMSQAWVSRVEKGTLTPDSAQRQRLEDALGALEPEDDPTSAERAGLEGRGPAAYKAARLARENQKRRTHLVLRLEQLQSKEQTTLKALNRERERTASFVERFVTWTETEPRASEALTALGARSPFPLQEGSEANSIIEVRNGVLHLLGVHASTAVAGVGAGPVAGGPAAWSAYNAVGAFATASTGSAIGALSGAAASSATWAMFGSAGDSAPRVPRRC